MCHFTGQLRLYLGYLLFTVGCMGKRVTAKRPRRRRCRTPLPLFLCGDDGTGEQAVESKLNIPGEKKLVAMVQPILIALFAEYAKDEQAGNQRVLRHFVAADTDNNWTQQWNRIRWKPYLLSYLVEESILSKGKERAALTARSCCCFTFRVLLCLCFSFKTEEGAGACWGGEVGALISSSE
jgi:hypothetical protein